MKKSPLIFALNPELIAEGFTQSELQMLDNCGEKWYLSYNELLKKRGVFSWALTYGTWFHSFCEQFYATKGKRWSVDNELPMPKKELLLQQLQESEYWQKLIQVQCEIYASHRKHDHKLFETSGEHLETIIDLEFEGIRLKGRIDMYPFVKAYKGHYVWDNKTTSRFDRNTIIGWDFRFQFMFYAWLAWKKWPNKPPHGIYINAIRKSALKLKQSESVFALIERVRQDMMERPETYFYRERLILKKHDLQHFEDTILRPKLERIKILIDPDIPPEVKSVIIRNKNTDHCIHFNQVCPFLPCCQHGLDLEREQYYKRPVKHEELEEESYE